jgi:hypothetical protein
LSAIGSLDASLHLYLGMVSNGCGSSGCRLSTAFLEFRHAAVKLMQGCSTRRLSANPRFTLPLWVVTIAFNVTSRRRLSAQISGSNLFTAVVQCNEDRDGRRYAKRICFLAGPRLDSESDQLRQRRKASTLGAPEFCGGLVQPGLSKIYDLEPSMSSPS